MRQARFTAATKHQILIFILCGQFLWSRSPLPHQPAPPPRTKEISPMLHKPHVQPSSLAVPIPVPVSIPTSRSTARLKRPRPRPQTAPASPIAPHSPTPPTSKSPRAVGALSGFKSIFRSLLGRTA
ncbi:uncharacterized protein BJ212DRAFT_747294 [Suillus subaureus]|uniref:Uncharacterized protein n=1 Tax=Suillus subaureus TaxID=48587 RepID=A0A9P7E007_9AGAM|nr:uncharacterized protein BJ212DRAFT_747294 [Suillus subaureus]KAG1807473.1 hypothetical protein BJ212DRAFT_747294 [Suillus subaureus]